MAHTKLNEELESFYSNTEKKYEDLCNHKVTLYNRIAWIRLAVFVGMLVSLYLGFDIHWACFLFSLTLLIIFIGLIQWSLRTGWYRDHYQILSRLNLHEQQALQGDYSMFDDGTEFIDRTHPYTYDLDVFGDQSLFQYMNRSYTRGGQEMLGRTLSSLMVHPEQIKERQQAISEMAKHTHWRQEFQAQAKKVGTAPLDLDRILKWIQERIFRSIFYPLLSFILPLGFLVLLTLSIFKHVPIEITLTYLIVPLMVSGMLLKRTNAFQNGMYRVLVVLRKFEHLIRHIENANFKSTELVTLQQDILEDGMPASRIIQKLGAISDAFESRRNLIVAIFLNAFILWDIHCLMRFERWKKRHGHKIQIWLNTVYEYDALSSMGTLAFNHPDFSFPDPTEREQWEFQTMGHPLLDRHKRIDNDHTIEGRGTIHIVTGPNMAGKSTFLRAIGTNLILAQSGNPVCAKLMVFRPIRLFTSMRTTDSLQKNESYFYSELKRLKALFEMEKDQSTVFFLLDEILKGTNSIDQTRGSMAIMEKLVKMNVAGLIATHNISLADMEKRHSDRVANFCFEVGHDKDRLTFDYQLRKGITTNMNATALMAEMGLI